MFRAKINLTFYTTVILLTLLSAGSAAPYKEIELRGLKVYSSNELYSILQMEDYSRRKIRTSELVNRIGHFYTSRGYALLRISIIENNPDKLILHIDEGEIGRIIIHNLNSYYSLKIRQELNSRNKIYNSIELNSNIKKIKEKYKITEITAELVPVKSFDENFFQLNRDLQSLGLGFAEIELFDDFNPLYDLHIHVEKFKRGKLLESDDGIGFTVNYKFSSTFIPEISYYKNDFITKGDKFDASIASGFDFGLNSFLKIPPAGAPQFPPERSFIDINSIYVFMPINSRIFTPLVKGRIYHTDTSRPDLGLKKYQYIQTRGIFAPGITLLKNLNIYAGAGVENVYFFGSSIDSSAPEYVEIEDKVERFPLVELQLKIDPIPIRIGNRIDQNLLFTYRQLFMEYDTRELEIRGDYDIEFKNLSILSLGAKTNLFFNQVPFHHQENVSSSYFKGFTGKSYYSEKQLALSSEYRFSVYEDYIYTGIFAEVVFFEATGFEISGNKKGYIAGPTARFLIYDQFEMILYFGRDILLPDNTSQNNFSIRLRKKW